jgi:hypothetical protein
MLSQKERKALGSSVSDDFLMAHEAAIRQADEMGTDALMPMFQDAMRGVGDPEAVEVAKQIASGRFGPMNDATAAIEVAAVALRNRMLAAKKSL